MERHVPRTSCPTVALAARVRRKQLRSEDDSHPVERVEHEVENQSASQCRLAIVPDFVPVPGIAKAAEGKYQVIDEGDLGMGPRRVGYFISGNSRLSGELEEYPVEGERVFESPEKPFTTADLVPAGTLNSDVAMVPQNA